MSDAETNWLRRPARTYSVLPDGRAECRVMLAHGDRAFVVTPWHTGKDPMILSVEDIARDCGLPAGEVVGREYTAVGDAAGLRDFRLKNDPRL